MLASPWRVNLGLGKVPEEESLLPTSSHTFEGVGREQGVKEIFGVYFEAGTSRVGLWIGGGL